MTIDLDKYSNNKNYVLSWYKENGNGDINYSISLMASVTSVPAIAIAFWLGEVLSWDPVPVKTIKVLIDYYGYTEIINKPPNSPNFGV